MGTDFQKFGRPYWLTAAVIPVFITGHPVITKWGNYSTFNIFAVVEYLSKTVGMLNVL